MKPSFHFPLSVFLIVLLSGFLFCCEPTREDAIDNFKNNKQEIMSLIRCYNSLPHRFEMLEFKDSSRIDIRIVDHPTPFKSNIIIERWNIRVNPKKVRDALDQVGLTMDNLYVLRTKLKEANVISISTQYRSVRKDNLWHWDKNNYYLKIGYKRQNFGFGMFFYAFFSNAKIRDEVIKHGGEQIDDNVYLFFGRGAV